MVRDFQSVIGREAREQMLERFGRLPHTVVACVGGGSNAIGIFSAFLDDPEVELVGVEAAGQGLDSGHHSATLSAGTPGVLHGSLSYLLQDADGQVAPAHSVSAGPGLSRGRPRAQLAARHAAGCATRRRPMREALDAFQALAGSKASSRRSRPRTRSPGCGASAGRWTAGAPVLVCLSGRGDKDVAHVADLLGNSA